MRTRLTGRLSLLFLTFALMLAMPAVALADLVTVSDADTLQASGDTTKQVGQTGSARFHLLVPHKDSDPVSGCNANESNKVRVTASSTAKNAAGQDITSPITFTTPGYVDLQGCDDAETTPTIEGAKFLGYTVGSSAQVGDVITVTAAASGGKVKSGGTTGNYSYDTFKITVVAPPEQGTALSVSPANGTYGGNTSLSATLSAGGTGVANKSVDFTFNGQSVGSATTDSSGKATLADVSLSGLDAGTHADAVSASYAGTGSSCTTNCYGASAGTAALTVDAKQLTGSFTADDKEYDGGTSATVASKSLPGVLTGDTVSLDVTNAQFDTKNVGTGKTVTANLALSGADASNYSLSSATGTDTASITAKSLTGSFTADDKVYDGNNSATVTNRTLNGAVNGDTVSLTGGTATFADENVGPNKTVTLTGATLAGADAGNYNLASVGTTTAAITAKELTGSFTAENKVYDGTTDATIATSNLVGVIQGDDVGLSGDGASFADKNVANGKTVTVNSGALSGTDASNYTLKAGPWTATANITPKSITGSFTADDKVYDGNDSATVTGRSLSGVIAGDDVSLDGGTAKFSNKNVGTDKPVTLTSASLVGADQGNYTLGSVSNDQADITARNLTVSATGINKVYDGSAGATVNLSTDKLSGDTVTAGYTDASFANKNVGTGKAVSVNGISISGADAANYNLTNATASTTADITARGLVVTATAANKTYDGNASATVSLSDNRVSGDVLSTSYASASFDNANAGTGKVVTVSGISVAGADSGNYTFNTSTTTSANIAQRAITVTADAKTKLFGDPDPALTYQVSGGPLVSGDSFSGSLTRAPGETVGQHDILQGSVSAGPNYAIKYVGAKLTIGAWTTKGFYSPVDMSTTTLVFNTVKGGSTVPLKFELFKGDTELTDTTAIKSLQAQKVICTTGAEDLIEELAATGGTSLRYDATGGQYIYNWKTPTGAGTCYKVTVTAQDGSALTAYFKLK